MRNLQSSDFEFWSTIQSRWRDMDALSHINHASYLSYMESARVELEDAVNKAKIETPIAPIYQNFDANGYTDPNKIRLNLISQLTSPVRWTQSVNNMIENNVKKFIECGPGRVLQGLVKKINRETDVSSL